MVVVVETVFAVVGDVDVRPAVVVVIGCGHTKSPALLVDAGPVGDIGERAVVIVVEEAWRAGRALRLVGGERRAVQQVNVQPAVVVVVKQGYAGAGSFEDGAFRRRPDVMKFVEAGLPGDVDEDYRCTIDEAAGGDGPRERVLKRERERRRFDR